jgi:hypothetical protein
LKHNYIITNNDLKYFIDFLNILFSKCYGVYNPTYLTSVTENDISQMIKLFNDHNVFLNKELVLNLLNSSIYKCNTVSDYHITSLYNYYLMVIHQIIKTALKDKRNDIPKLNYVEYLIYNTSNHKTGNCSYLSIILNLLLDNNLLDINDNIINRLLINNNISLIKSLIETNKLISSENLMNIACSAGNIEFIKLLINNKVIPTIKNLYYITHYAFVNLSTINILITTLIDGGLPLNDETLEFLISKNFKLDNLDNYGLDDSKLIEKLCIKRRKFPYQAKFPSVYEPIFSKLNNDYSIIALEEVIDKFDEEYKKISLMEHFIILDVPQNVLYLKNKFPEIKISKEIIYKSPRANIYLDIFDLKI